MILEATNRQIYGLRRSDQDGDGEAAAEDGRTVTGSSESGSARPSVSRRQARMSRQVKRASEDINRYPVEQGLCRPMFTRLTVF